MEDAEEETLPEAEELGELLMKYVARGLNENWDSVDKRDRPLLQDAESFTQSAIERYIQACMRPNAGTSPREAADFFIHNITVMLMQHKLETSNAIKLETDLGRRREEALQFIAENSALLYPSFEREELMKKASEKFSIPLEA